MKEPTDKPWSIGWLLLQDAGDDDWYEAQARERAALELSHDGYDEDGEW